MARARRRVAKDLDALFEREREFHARLRRHHLPHGQIRSAEFGGGPGNAPTGYRQGSDGALMTGLYLGYLSLAYSAARSRVESAHVHEALDTMEMLTTAGGVAGRVCRQFYPGEPQECRHHAGKGPHAGLSFEMRTSRDQVTGVLWGLALCASRFPDPSARARSLRLIEDVVMHHFDPDSTTRRARWRIPAYGREPQRWMTFNMRLFCAGVGARLLAAPELVAEYQRLLKQVPTVARLARRAAPFHRHAEYFVNHLNLCRYWLLIRLESDTGVRGELSHLLASRFRTVVDHGNTLFNFFVLDPAVEAARVDRRTLLDSGIQSLRQLTEAKLWNHPRPLDQSVENVTCAYGWALRSTTRLFKGLGRPMRRSK
ncbi:MAG: hypothetical protein DWQ08_01395, partial [Proteobacteria bacterium]